MDKNYNVDDILSEIKSRKSREKGSVHPPAFPGGQSEPLGEFSPAPHLPQPPQVRQEPHASSGEEEGFRFQFPASDAPPSSFAPPSPQPFSSPPAPRPREERPNPMGFEGHVRPLTDRAKMHPNRLSQPRMPQQAAPPPQEEFRPNDATSLRQGAPVDFSAFRAPGLPEEPPDDRTRVLPQFETGQNLSPEDIRQIDFSGMEDDAGPFYEEDEEDFDFGRSSIDYSEYNSKSHRKDVALDIARVKLWLFIRTGLTALLTLMLFWLAFSGNYYLIVPLPAFLDPNANTQGYMIAGTLLSVLVALVNSSSMGGGIISLFKMRANSDSLAAFAMLGAICQCIMGTVKHETVIPAELNFYYSIAALAMLFNALGKMSMINRIQSNFRIIASERPKKALLTVESDSFCHEFIPDATLRKPTIAYSAGADFFTDFLGLSYSDKYDVGIHRAVAPVCLIGALIVGVSSYFLTGNMFAAVSSFTAILCVCASLSATFVENIPLGKLTKKLAPQGGMVSGNKAVEDFCDTKGLVLTEQDLFPKGHVALHGIKAFSKARIDEAILDAASVICAMDGALSPIFLEMIGGNKKLLRKVDNIVYEQGMGISAWVNSHRVLIGNRQLMHNHGITLPTDNFEKGSTEIEGDPLYLSSSGEASARFVVSYHIDEELAEQLDLLSSRETRLIIYTSDANITPRKLWELYGYPEDLISIMPTRQQAEYRKMAAHRENAMAEIVYTGKASTLVKSILACMSARSSILTATVIQLVQVVLGYGLVAFIAFMGTISSLSIVQLLVYQLFWFVSIFIVQKVRQT